ncbi:MAG: LysR family transcriptional regulator [Pseudonocardia sp.]|nr:LysR family transcriptional regulator [Pseudonocardia sp.]
MELDVRHLRIFLAVARCGSFSRAAAVHGLTQPAVTAHIQRLERHFGVRLFNRTTRVVRLTDAGHRLVPLATRVVVVLGEAEEAMAGDGRPVLRLNAEAPALGRVVGRLRQLFPAVEFDVAVDLSELSVSQIRAGSRHMAQVYDFPAAPLALDGLRSTVLLREPIWVVLPRSHPLAAADSVSLTQLAGDPWVLRPAGQRLRRLVVDACRAAGFDPRVRHAATDGSAIERMIEEFGCVTLGSPINAGSPSYVQRPVREAVERTLRLVWSVDEVAARVVAAVGEVMRQQYVDVARVNNPEYAETLSTGRPSSLPAPAAGQPATGADVVPTTVPSVRSIEAPMID